MAERGTSLSDLRKMIADEEAELAKLRARREELARDLGGVAQAIVALRGTEGATAAAEAQPKKAVMKRRGRRMARGKKAAAPVKGIGLGDAIMQVLGKSRKALTPTQIAEELPKTGYALKGGHPATIVSMALGRGKQFEKTGDGAYRLKK